MELKYYRLIKTIVEEGNIACSSERLFLTQSALSHQLRVLEEQLGFKVFIRTRNNWELTPEGRELYQLGNKVFEIIEKGFKNIEQIKEGSKGIIRLSMECMSLLHGLPDFMQKMAVLYPNIQINIMAGTPDIISKILSDEIDMAIVTHRPNHHFLDYIEVFEDEIFALMHPEHTFGKEPFLDAFQFTNIHLIINSPPIESVSVYGHFLKYHNVLPKKITAIPFTEVSLEMVKNNMGITTGPKWQYETFKDLNPLIFKPISENGLKRTHYIVVKKENRKRRYIQDFISNFQEEF